MAVAANETAWTGIEAFVLLAEGRVHRVNTASCEAASPAYNAYRREEEISYICAIFLDEENWNLQL